MIANAESSERNSQVQAAIEGDGEAVDALWRENRGWVAAVLLAYKPAYAELEDLLQEVAMTMVSKIHTLRQGNLFRGWLRVIAANTARGAARAGKNRPVVSDDLEGMAEPRHPFPQAEDLDETDQVRALVAALPDTYREPLLLRAVRGLKSSVIAEILSISEPTVDTRVARARRMLRERRSGNGNVGMNPVKIRSQENSHG